MDASFEEGDGDGDGEVVANVVQVLGEDCALNHGEREQRRIGNAIEREEDEDEEEEEDEDDERREAGAEGTAITRPQEEDSAGMLRNSFSPQHEDHRHHDHHSKADDMLARFVLPALDTGELDDMGGKNGQQEQEQPERSLVSIDGLGFHKQDSSFSFSIAGNSSRGSDRVYRKGIWMLPELLALQTARKAGMGKFGYRTRNTKSEKERWQDIENVLWLQGVQRSADQCRSRWEYISREFRKITEYESSSAQLGQSYWHMSQAERKDKDLPINFYVDLFQAMSEWMGPGKAAAMSSSSGTFATEAMDGKAVELSGKPVFNDAGMQISPMLGRGMHSSSLEMDNNSNPIGCGKRRKMTSKAISTEQNHRAAWPREIQLQPEEGSLLLCNCSVIHLGTSPPVVSKEHVLIKNKRIAYIGSSLSYYASQIVDLGGRFLLPGLCDAHVHVTAVTANLHDISLVPASLITARASKILQGMLMRGFTTVRDVGGCDWGLAKAVEEGTILGPRILFCGRALSQTGGHGDMRMPNEEELCSCSSSLTIGRVCDGVTEVRKAARDELRKGANHIKIMASGGVSSPTDHLNSLQFSSEEISAAVEEASHCGKYVCAHAYTAAAAKRALELGVRSIEHGNLVDEDCLDLLKRKGAFLVPTLVTYEQIRRQGIASGMAAELVAKVGDLVEKGLDVVAQAEQKGVNICFGTDLLGAMHEHQLEEFGLRSRVQSSVSILRSATSTCARLFNMEGQIGTVSEGADADLLVLNKNPIADISVLEDPSNLVMILKQGEAVKPPKAMAAKNVDGRTWSQIM